jgi:hydrogenase nickel incorporation protein HypA/HybF
MHELSVAMSLVEMASAAAAQAGVERVTRVHLQLGALAGVVRGALEFSFEIAAEGTPLAGAELLIEELPVKVDCEQCGCVSELASIQQFRCPRCGAPTSRVVQGRELQLIALEYDEQPAALIG